MDSYLTYVIKLSNSLQEVMGIYFKANKKMFKDSSPETNDAIRKIVKRNKGRNLSLNSALRHADIGLKLFNCFYPNVIAFS